MKKSRSSKEGGALNKAALERASAKDLKRMCEERGLSAKGSKSELAARLLGDGGAGAPAAPKEERHPKAKAKQKGRAQKEAQGAAGGLDEPKTLCSVCGAALAGDERFCTGCDTELGERMVVLFDSDNNVHMAIPPSCEISKMVMADLLRIAQAMNLEQDLGEQDLREILTEVVQEMEVEQAREEVGLRPGEDRAVAPSHALEQINQLRDSEGGASRALPLYDRLLESLADHEDKEMVGRVLVQKGLCLQGVMDLVGAIAAFESALRSNPESAEAQTLLTSAKVMHKALSGSGPGDGATSGNRPPTGEATAARPQRRVVDMAFKPQFSPEQRAQQPVLISPMPERPARTEEADTPAAPQPQSKEDERFMSEVERMSLRLERLKKIRERVDVGDLEAKGKNGGGLTVAAQEPPQEAQKPSAPPAKRTGATLGSESLDSILGGIPAGLTVLVKSPPLAGRDVMFNSSVAANLRRGISAIIITASEPIVVLRGKIGDMFDRLCELESSGGVLWIDPRSQKIKDRYQAAPGASSDHAMILQALQDDLESARKSGRPVGVFVSSLTPITAYREPREIRAFLGSVTRLVSEQADLGLFCIESDMHDEAELRLLEEQMGAVMELKERAPGDGKGGLLLQVKRMPGIGPTRWLPFRHDEASFSVEK